MFSHRQRVARVRRLAVRALDAYPLVDPQLRFIADEENTTFRVDATAPMNAGGSCCACIARHACHDTRV
jgi:hypothetical protein